MNALRANLAAMAHEIQTYLAGANQDTVSVSREQLVAWLWVTVVVLQYLDDQREEH